MGYKGGSDRGKSKKELAARLIGTFDRRFKKADSGRKPMQ